MLIECVGSLCSYSFRIVLISFRVISGLVATATTGAALDGLDEWGERIEAKKDRRL